MAKFVEIDYIIEVLNEYPSSNTNKIINAIKEEYIYDANDIRSWDAIAKIIICLLWVMTMTFLMLNYNLIKL